jgi:hypothetical protein
LFADSADADRDDKVKEKIKKAFEKVKERIGRDGGGGGKNSHG